MATPSKVKLPAQLTAVEDLLLWHNVPKSGGVLAIATVLYIMLEWTGTPLLAWLSNIGIVLILTALIWAGVARFAGMTGPAAHLPPFLRTGLDEATVRALAEKARVFLNDTLSVTGRILGGDDFVLAGKALVALYVIGVVGRIITPIGLLYTVVLGLFTLPKVYEMRKEQIDDAMGQVYTVAQQQISARKAQATELISKLTPQKGPRPAASDFSKSE